MEKQKTYNILIKPIHAPDAAHTIELTTHDIEWSMDQYRRNRDPFTWEIIK